LVTSYEGVNIACTPHRGSFPLSGKRCLKRYRTYSACNATTVLHAVFNRSANTAAYSALTAVNAQRTRPQRLTRPTLPRAFRSRLRCAQLLITRGIGHSQSSTSAIAGQPHAPQHSHLVTALRCKPVPSRPHQLLLPHNIRSVLFRAPYFLKKWSSNL
jgi:hypothetical protein